MHLGKERNTLELAGPLLLIDLKSHFFLLLYASTVSSTIKHVTAI